MSNGRLFRIAGVSLGCAACIAVLVVTGLTGGLDEMVHNAVIGLRTPWLDGCMKAVTHMGDAGPIILMAGGLLLLPHTSLRLGVPAAASTALAVGISQTLKALFRRARPDEAFFLIHAGSYSFPSNHAAVSMGLFAAMGLMAGMLVRKPCRKVAVYIICAIPALLVAFSRVYLGVHYFSDVAAGSLLGLAVAAGVCGLYRKYNLVGRVNRWLS